ncbi:MAG: lysylphosphatidylglycerol synthase transmembrane domain-containing protein [Bacteroidota bacterium]
MHLDGKQILRHVSPKRIVWPVLIGLLVTAWLFLRDFDAKAFSAVEWTGTSTLWILLAVVSVVIRDWAYMVRIRVLTDQHLDWRRAFVVIMLWEFSSALAPGMLGGGFLFAIFILNREGINMGRSITAIMNSSFLDGIFLAVMAPLVYYTAGKSALFSGVQLHTTVGNSIFITFWAVYFLILAYKLFVAYALFVNPHLVRKLLLALFSVPLLKRWKHHANETGEQLVIASQGLKGQNRSYWMWSIGTTFASWTARYSIVNCILHAFDTTTPINDYVVYGKQVIMGIIILLSPTPGGSGLAEIMFGSFLGEFITQGLSSTLSMLWRMLSYYPYLFIGAILLPRWIRKYIKVERLKL